MTLIDVHQHLWPEALLEALARRGSAPCLRRLGADWLLHVPGEPPSSLAPDVSDMRGRAAALEAAGVDAGLVALSSVLGVEGLPGQDARELIAAYAAGVAALPDGFEAWGSIPLAGTPDLDDVDAILDAGFVGLSVPAGALAGLDELARLAPVLERLEALDAPLFVHPGPSPWERPDPSAQPEQVAGVPGWWLALTVYVEQMNAAWHAFATDGRRRHPRLRVLFAMLAGLAPLHRDRLELRGGGALDTRDENVFYDTSSYGADVVCALTRVVGGGQIVMGSDSPVLDARAPDFGVASDVWRQVLADNAARLLGRPAHPLSLVETAP
jgi:predicted TIM-barrel fold metal-dependent hydrolase